MTPPRAAVDLRRALFGLEHDPVCHQRCDHLFGYDIGHVLNGRAWHGVVRQERL